MSHPQILVNRISFHLPTGQLFDNLTLSLFKRKVGLVGRNGIGKSTLIKLIWGELQPSSGSILISGKLEYIPQQPSFSQEMTVGSMLGYEEKINALHCIMQGETSEKNFSILSEEWDIEERLNNHLKIFNLNNIPYNKKINILSGGEITRLLLARAFFSNSDFLLLDEPTNYLDQSGRKILYKVIKEWKNGLIIVSHDRILLSLVEEIIELSTLGLVHYGGNYDTYENQKTLDKTATLKELNDAKKSLTKTKKSIQLSLAKHEKKQSYGKKLKKGGSIDKLTANASRERSEKTKNNLRIKEKHLVQASLDKLKKSNEKIEVIEKIHFYFPETEVNNGEIIVDIENISFSYQNSNHLLIQDFNMIIQGPERIALIGDNGMGKTTLIKLLLKELIPQSGKIYVGTDRINYLDQNINVLKPNLSILENFFLLNPNAREHDAYSNLAKFLFKNIQALKLVRNLSGGEKLRALFSCIFTSKCFPKLLILDEPTNHLDISSIKSIESILMNYQGALIVISHDKQFLENIDIKRNVYAPFKK